MNALLPQGVHKIYAYPPNILVDFGLIKSNTVWLIERAVYGLRVSPRLWGEPRDKILRGICFPLYGRSVRLFQSAIDAAMWIVVHDDGFVSHHLRTVVGYLLTYVDDFLLFGPKLMRNLLEEEIAANWKIQNNRRS